MIELHDVTKTFRTGAGEVRALDQVRLIVSAGEFVAVRGPSGSGKSTLLSLVGGLALPSSGRVLVGGHEVSSMSAAARARFRADQIGFVFQMFHLLPYLSALDNVLMASANGVSRRTEAADLLARFGLGEREGHRPGQLSAGERQRVALARALLNKPRLLLADEPTGNLDPQNAKLVLDLLAGFHADGGTVVLVTHHEEAARYAQRSIDLVAGRLPVKER